MTKPFYCKRILWLGVAGASLLVLLIAWLRFRRPIDEVRDRQHSGGVEPQQVFNSDLVAVAPATGSDDRVIVTLFGLSVLYSKEWTITRGPVSATLHPSSVPSSLTYILVYPINVNRASLDDAAARQGLTTLKHIAVNGINTISGREIINGLDAAVDPGLTSYYDGLLFETSSSTAVMFKSQCDDRDKPTCQEILNSVRLSP